MPDASVEAVQVSETEVVVDLLTARPVGDVGAMRSAQGAVEKKAVVCGESVAGGVERTDPDRVVLATGEVRDRGRGLAPLSDPEPTNVQPIPHDAEVVRGRRPGQHHLVSLLAAVLTSVGALGGVTSRQAAVDTNVDFCLERFPAPSNASTPSVYPVLQTS